jgi:nitroimidazol reductase NimA-like FMN-containing flavoprotein (pyridoxamine 5'-phosphate oxidase superfamily)
MNHVMTADPLSAEECLRLLDTVSVGRVVFSDAALPAAQPVNFVALRDGVVFGLGQGSPAAAALQGSVVAFEADAYDEQRQTAWTVLVVGHAEEATDPEAARAVAARGRWPWSSGPSDRIVRVRYGRVSGHRFGGAHQTSG